MRAIEFRGKRIDNGEWVEGDLVHSKRFDRSESYTEIYTELNAFEVDPSTVGEFIGLCDKNGKKIFEGDVILVNYENDGYYVCDVPESWSEMYEVYFDDNYHAWFTKLNGEEVGEWLYEYDGGCEIVGNIHDNPELLQEGKDAD